MAGRTITTNRNIRSIQPLHRQTRFILPNPPLHPESPLGWLGIEPTSLVFPLVGGEQNYSGIDSTPILACQQKTRIGSIMQDRQAQKVCKRGDKIQLCTFVYIYIKIFLSLHVNGVSGINNYNIDTIDEIVVS